MGVDTQPEILAVLQHGGQRWLGKLAGSRGDGPPRLLFPAGRAPDELPLGTRVTVGLATRQMNAATKGRANLMAVEHVPTGALVSIMPDDPQLLTSVPTAGERVGDRRSWLRVAAHATAGPVVAARLEGGPASARQLSGRLVDVSGGGVAIAFPLASEQRLCTVRTLWCTLQLPGEEAPTERALEVRNRALLPRAVRYGLAFRSQTPDPAPPRAYEAQWTCGCGADDLLADSHLHCCACGTPRGAVPTRLPDWDSLIPVEHHRFTGADRTCARCGSAWAATARNCGHCGTRLPVRGTGP